MEARPNIVIGMPRALPPESRYTVSAQAWADALVCEHVLADLDSLFCNSDVKIGIADIPTPDVRLVPSTGLLRERQVVNMSRQAAESALTDVRERAQGSVDLPPGLALIRTLHVIELDHEHRVTEYQLSLDELSSAQLHDLLRRGWRLVGVRAELSLPPDAYEREVEWLTAKAII